MTLRQRLRVSIVQIAQRTNLFPTLWHWLHENGRTDMRPEFSVVSWILSRRQLSRRFWGARCGNGLPADIFAQRRSDKHQPIEVVVTIAIIGTGNVGSALARGWSRAGQRVVLGVRDRSAPNLMTLARQTSAEVKPPAEAAEIADVVVLALPWQVAEGAVKALGEPQGKIVIDCMNPLAMRRQAGTGPRPSRQVRKWWRNGFPQRGSSRRSTRSAPS